MAYSDLRLENSHLDFYSNVAPVVNLQNCSAIEMNLVLSNDGVNIKKSTYRKKLWPVWLQCSSLLTILRMSQKNIILACLFVGSGAPNWNDIVTRLRAELITPIEINSPDFPRKTIVFKVRLLVADMCCEAHVLNMMDFNGFFGSHFCTAEGKTIGKTHAYYPFQQSGSIWEPELINQFVQRAELASVCLPFFCIQLLRPSGQSLVKQMKKNLSNQTRAYLASSKSVVIFLNFINQLQKVLKRNLSQIVA